MGNEDGSMGGEFATIFGHQHNVRQIATFQQASHFFDEHLVAATSRRKLII
jgi:hypothetical protein